MDVWVDYLAGCLAGIGGTFVGHPIDTVKVLQQTHHGNLTARHGVQLAVKLGGVTGLYRGMSSPVYTAALVNAAFFGTYGTTLKLMENSSTEPTKRKEPGYESVVLAGMVAGAVQLLISCPVDLVKIKLQTGVTTGAGFGITGSQLPNEFLTTSSVNRKTFKGPIDCLMTLYKTQGCRGFYKGLVPMFWRDAPSYGIYMGLYEFILREGKKRTTWSESALSLIGGGITGTVTWILVLPIDVVKSRIQADCSENPKYRGMVDCIRVSYYTDGWRVFFRGFFTIASRALIVNAATFFVYQKTLQYFHH